MVTGLYPEIEPYERGMLEAGDEVFWVNYGAERLSAAIEV